MANLIFSDIEQVMDILMGEMPPGVFASDRADYTDTTRNSYSSSEIRAHANIYSNLYSNLQDIWENKFISTLQPDGLNRWEIDLFASAQNAALSFAQRQANLLVKWQSRGGLSYPYIYGLISTLLTPLGLSFDLNAYCGMPEGAWLLDISELDLETYLADSDPIWGARTAEPYSLDCYAQIITLGTTANMNAVVSGIPSNIISNIHVGAGITGAGIPNSTTILSVGVSSVTMSQQATAAHVGEAIQIQNYLAAGLTQAQFQSIQATAYTYGVNIYGNADAMTISALEQILTTNEPAGSTYQIFNNATPPPDPNILDLGGGSECTLINAFDCGNGLIGATYNVWDFSLPGGFE